jgi:hypothetical protein
MTMLMHSRDPFGPAPASTERPDTNREAAAQRRLALIKRVCRHALVVLAAGGALTAIIALKAAIYYWRFHN